MSSGRKNEGVVMPPVASGLVAFGIPAIALVVAVLWLVGLTRAQTRLGETGPRARRVLTFAVLGTVLWVALFSVAAYSGVLRRWDARPPPMAFMFIAIIGGGIALGLSPIGKRLAGGLSLAALVGFQSFRFPLELVMHEAAREHVMPVEMSFSGYNFDIVTGLSAIVVAAVAALGSAPRWLVAAWNALGSALLAAIAAVAFLSSPMVRAFGAGADHVNTWVTFFPYVLLPCVMVTAAVAGHVVVWRALGRAPV
jgi:hypothetical protein